MQAAVPPAAADNYPDQPPNICQPNISCIVRYRYL